mmetsp:Transcript_90789/g.174790  ORF Transcript_90789/g.174790 Transcript_90789/m.174790 type:complete len:176 (-) Transcript_90789:35-562(-)
MFCSRLGLLPLCLYFATTSANPEQGNQQTSCLKGSCTNSLLQKKVQRVQSAVHWEEDEDDDADDGKPLQKPKTGRATGGASFAQAGMKREKKATFMEDEEESGASSQKRQPRARSQTFGMALAQTKTAVAKAKSVVFTENEGVQEDDFVEKSAVVAEEEGDQEDNFVDQLPGSQL